MCKASRQRGIGSRSTARRCSTVVSTRRRSRAISPNPGYGGTCSWPTTDAEAEQIGVPAFHAMTEHRAAMRLRVLKETGAAMPGVAGAPPAARMQVQHSLICGAPETVAEAVAALADTGIGGLLMQMRLGPMPHELAERSLHLFMERVAPELRREVATA